MQCSFVIFLPNLYDLPSFLLLPSPFLSAWSLLYILLHSVATGLKRFWHPSILHQLGNFFGWPPVTRRKMPLHVALGLYFPTIRSKSVAMNAFPSSARATVRLWNSPKFRAQSPPWPAAKTGERNKLFLFSNTCNSRTIWAKSVRPSAIGLSWTLRIGLQCSQTHTLPPCIFSIYQLLEEEGRGGGSVVGRPRSTVAGRIVFGSTFCVVFST